MYISIRSRQASRDASFFCKYDWWTNCWREYPADVKQIGRWHDAANGSGLIIVDTDNQESLTGWIMGWSGACTFPIVKPVLDDANARKAIKAMIANQKG